MRTFIKDLSKTNRLYEVEFDGNLYYQIAHTENGTATTFEHDYTLVERVESYIEAHGRSLYKDAKNRLVFSKSKNGTPAISLAAFLYHCYHGMPIEQVRTAGVRHIGAKYLPDGSEDCRKQSLVHMSGVQYKTDSREFRPVTIGGVEFMEIRMKISTRPVYISNDPILVDLLADTSLFNNFSFNGRTGVQVELRGNTRRAPYIHQIACAVRMGLLTRENFFDLDNIIEQMKEGGEKQIDHLFADVFNNTYQNLSVMKRAVNELKSGYTAADFGRYLTAWAYDWESGDYLVEVATDGEERPAYYRCCGDENLLNCLEHLIGKNKMTQKIRYCKFVGADGEMVAVPLPNAEFEEEKRKYKADGGTGKYPKIEANTVDSVENGVRLLAMNQSEPGKFIPWSNTNDGVPLMSGLTDVLRNFGIRILAD